MEDKNQNNINSDSSKPDLSEEYLNNWKRERADFINYKKDEAQRMGEFVKFANESLILELLDIVDDLYLAAKQAKNAGLDQVIKKFEDFLKKYGVEKIKVSDPVKSPDGDNGASKFDPMTQEIVEGADGEKIEEVRAGYMMHGRIIRPTRVKIIK
ncbi:MAG: nucleotide exchange factor GrpE [Candidatus Yanofskybacteria bacterium]|nr:nucleotide exchange factor GrpE [Candidatus Yanofskybacteria bacterium]